MIELNKYVIHVMLNEKNDVNIHFAAKDTSDKFERANLELIGFAIDRFPIMGELVTGEQNLIVLILKLKEKITNIINESSLNEYEFSDYNYEKYIIINSFYTYIEHWGLCTRITTNDFLGILVDIEAFLNRWSNRKKILNEIKIAFSKFIVKRAAADYTYEHLSQEGDIFMLVVDNDQLKMDPNEYVNSLKLPEHMLGMHSNLDESE